MTTDIQTVFITDDNDTILDATVDIYESRQPGALMVFFLLLYSFICLIGTSGNLLVLYVIARYTKMKSVTNTYILNLALADCSFLIGLPMLIVTAVKQGWIFGHFMCKLYMILTSVNWFTSVFTLTVLSADRYLAVCHPMSSVHYRTQYIARRVCAGVWIASLLAMIPVVLYTDTVDYPPPGHTSCTVRLPDWMAGEEDGGLGAYRAFLWYIFALAFVLPVLVISIFYSLVIARLRRTTGLHRQTLLRRRSNRKVTQMVATVIAVYVVCWAPYYVHQMTLLYVDEQPPPWTTLLFQLFTILTYANSALNPLLYAFLGQNFRQSFKDAFHCAENDPFRPDERNCDLRAVRYHRGITSVFGYISRVGGRSGGRGGDLSEGRGGMSAGEEGVLSRAEGGLDGCGEMLNDGGLGSSNDGMWTAAGVETLNGGGSNNDGIGTSAGVETILNGGGVAIRLTMM